MISPSATIPQDSSTMPHFSRSSTAPADKRATLLCQQCKIEVQGQGETNMLIKMHYLRFFAQLESWKKKKLFKVFRSLFPLHT